jgi:hypothetical protein
VTIQKPESLEEALAVIEGLQKQGNSLESETAKLKATNEGLIKDLKKKQSIDRFLKVAGVDLNDEVDDDAIVELFKTFRAQSKQPEGQQQPQGGQQGAPAGQQGQAPSDAMDEAVKAQFASLRKEVNDLRKANEELEKDRNAEREKRRLSKLERMVTDELAKAECRRPSHLFKLMRDEFRLLEDESTVVYGPEHDPISLRDAVTRFRDDEEFSVYFAGSGATGSGLTTTRSSTTTYTNNPFSKDSLNVTKAAEILQKDPEKAKRLANEARMMGKLDPILAKAMASM